MRTPALTEATELKMRCTVVAVLFVASLGWPCDLTGSWYDNLGNLAEISQTASGELNVTAVSPVGWKTASGALIGNGTSLELSFGGDSPMSASISATCWTLRFSNMEQWQRGASFDSIVRTRATCA
jgi:hypothetical protein